MSGMQEMRAVALFLGLLFLSLGNLSVEGRSGLLENCKVQLVNYVTEVGKNVDILSPIMPIPIGLRWFSLNMDGELPRSVGGQVDHEVSTYLKSFQETYNTSWHDVFKFSHRNDRLRIRKIYLGYADLFRVFVGANETEEAVQGCGGEDQMLDVAITVMTFEKHECSFISKPQNPKEGDTLILNCSIIVNGMWNASLIFRNDLDQSEIIGETKTCGIQPSLGYRICNSVNLTAETDILAYGCHLKFPSQGRHIPTNQMFSKSKWSIEFNREAVCRLPTIYLEAIPSEVTFLCNQMPCGETAFVGDTVTCVAHGYPQPVFDLRIEDRSEEIEYDENHENQFFIDTDEDSFGSGNTHEVEIKGFHDIRIGPTNVGHINITCNASNELGWSYGNLDIEVKLEGKDKTATGAGYPGTFTAQSIASKSAIQSQNRTASEAAGKEYGGLDLQPINLDWGFHGNVYLMCGDKECTDGGVVNVGEIFHVDYYPSYGVREQLLNCSLTINHSPKDVAKDCNHKWSREDIGRISLHVRAEYVITENLNQNIRVISGWLDDVDILCNHVRCMENGIVKVGDVVTPYIDMRIGAGYSPYLYNWNIDNDKGNLDDFDSWKHTWTANDIGRHSIVLNFYAGQKGFTATRIVSVVSGPVFVSIDVMCNGKVCQENENMRFGDVVSCQYEPRDQMDGMTFTLLINDVATTEYQWLHVLREEDVGRKSIKCKINGKAGTFQNARNITVGCAFRDKVVMRPAKNRTSFNPNSYEIRYKQSNDIDLSGIVVVILCGDEPCDKPGRTIYTGTYLNCRLTNGQTAHLNLLLGKGNQEKVDITQGQSTHLAEISYKLTKADEGLNEAECLVHHVIITATTKKNVTFSVTPWPCEAILPASADVFGADILPASDDIVEHGEAAGAIDAGQGQDLDAGPPAGDKGVPKWNGDSGPSAGSNEASKSKDDLAEDNQPKPSVGSVRDSFVLLQLFLVFIAAFVGLVQY